MAEGYSGVAETPFEGFIEHHLRIGDTIFFVPPTAINVHKQMKNKRVQVLRARNSMVKESGYFDQVIEFTLFFPDRDSINNELRPLLAQVKKCPFLPVENYYLNNILKIEAVTIAGVTVQTTPDFPNTLQAQIQCYAFEHRNYIVDNDNRTFDEMINWPLFRWYYRRNLDPDIGRNFHTYYEPLYGELTDDFKFRIAAEDDLDAIKTWRQQKQKLLKDYIKAQRENFWGDKKREKELFEGTGNPEDYMAKKMGLDEMYAKAMFEYDIAYEDWDIPGLILTDLSIGFENTITSQQLLEDAMPSHQYLGSQDTIIVARFKTNNEECIASLEALLQRSAYLIRTYHKELANGFLEFDHPLVRLMGIRNVTIEDVQNNTVQGSPGTYEVTLTMCAYNRVERKLNELNWLSKEIEWEIDKYENQGIASLITSWIPTIPDPTSEYYDPNDWWLNNPLYRIGRFIADRPMFDQVFSNWEKWRNGHDGLKHNQDEFDIKTILYHDAVKNMFLGAEVYPDLELPTYGECMMAGFHVENTNGGAFVDPDFFINYREGTRFYEELIKAGMQEYKTELRDALGGVAYSHANGDFTNTNKKVESMLEQARKDYEKTLGKKSDGRSDSKHDSENSIDQSLVDEGNISRTDIEALIRDIAVKLGLDQNLPVAFAKVMDPDLKQFYDIGVNSNQDGVINYNKSTPVQMDKNMNYYTNTDGTIDGYYIGVMKVRPLYGSNIHMLGKNIKYNIETGVSTLANLYYEIERIFASQAGSRIYNEQNVYEVFKLDSNDTKKARYAGALMMYLGFENEYVELLKNNKKPSSKLVQLIQDILKQVDKETGWNQNKIQNELNDVPVKDFRTIYQTGNQSKKVKPYSEEDAVKGNSVHLGMMHDMIRYDKRGRLVRAFPTFFLAFIDEGQFIGTIKLSDQFFQYQAVMDIMYNNSRKDASSTLYLEMSNVYGTLDDQEKSLDLATTSYTEVFKTLTLPGAVAREAEASRNRNQNYYKSIMLRTGTRVHFRMGYGSNPLEMPTILNGTITSIQNNSETITVVVQDDGIELTNKIRADVNETTDGGFLFSKKEPTEIVDELLTDSQGFFKNLWAGLSNKEYEEHSLGLMHFGNQGNPQGWQQVRSSAPGAFGGMLAGARIGSRFGPVGAAIGAIGGFIGGGLFGDMTFGKDARQINEINMNVYQTTGLTNEQHDKWWNKMFDAFGLGEADEPGININLFDKTVWDVLNICAHVGDDHIVAVHPFGFRSTIFSGKPYYPLYYDYIVEDESIVATAQKPFRQFHAYDSATAIIDNSIRTTEENIRTVGVGVYLNEGEVDTTAPVYVDTNIWPEKQRVVNIDTTLNAKGVRLVQNIPIIGNLLNKPLKWYFDEGVAIKITARALSDYVRDMYDGYLTIVGDPSIKPYDQMWIYDTYNDITGPADVKEVTHIMNHQTGFITMIKPDAVVVNSDTRSLQFMMAAQHIAAVATLTHMIRKKINNSKYAGVLPIVNSAWASVQKRLDRLKKKVNLNQSNSRFVDTLTGKRDKYQDAVKKRMEQLRQTGSKAADVTRWAKNGMLHQLQKATGHLNSSQLSKLLKGSSQFSINLSTLNRFKNNATELITNGGRKIKGAFSSGGISKLVSSRPAQMIIRGIPYTGVFLITAAVSELIERWLFSRQACIVAPLSKDGMEFTAGLNGHKGAVVGDSPDMWQALLTNDFVAFILGFLGADTAQFSQDNRQGSFQVQSSQQKDLDVDEVIQNLFDLFRSQPESISDLEELYNTDRKAALEQINKRLELLNKRETKPDYSDLMKKLDEEWNSLTSGIKGWFSNLWDSITGVNGSDGDGIVCVPADGTKPNGKAVGLSSYFNVIGPKIEKEAESQGLGAYAEVIKALVMQESGGNYKRYPDVMQASESLGKPPGYIKDVDYSIQVGVQHFGRVLKRANGDIRLALQSYNYGGGFIDWVNKRGGQYTKDLAWEFAEYMVKKMGRKISSIPPGYGDSKYVDRVLRYYQGELPSAACTNHGAVEGPSVVGAEGKKKYHTTTGKELVNIPKGPWTIAGMVSNPKLRQGTINALKNAAQIYGKNVVITSAWRKGDPNWHGTGWAVDVDTPNTMVWRGGKLRFPNGKDKDDARKLVKACIEAGFRGLYFGDWDIVQEVKSKYGNVITYEPSQHHNHLHLSYPKGK